LPHVRPTFELKVAGRKVVLGERTLIMGVLNATPDSFSDGGLYFAPDRAIRHGVELVRQGAHWIDLGGESTRPGSQPVSAEEELRRVLPVVRGLRKRLPSVHISIDTTKAAVAEGALQAGASIVNDISGLRFDASLADVARRYRAPLILMHMRGRPATMQRRPFAQDVWRSVFAGLETSIRRALAAGVERSQVVLDPGLGFGKSRRQNYTVLASVERLQRFHLPILIGASRKSFVQAVVAGEGLDPARARELPKRYWPVRTSKAAVPPAKLMQLLMGDGAAVVAAILGGAHIVRVHDPGAVLPAVRVADALVNCF